MIQKILIVLVELLIVEFILAFREALPVAWRNAIQDHRR